MENQKLLAKKIQNFRKEEKVSQQEVADKFGVSEQPISKWESGQGNPAIDNVVKLTEIYNVSADYILLGRENNISVSEPEKKMEPEKKTMSKEARVALAVISVIAAIALVTVLFIIALGMYAELLEKEIELWD